jgi:hypothetical protein
VALALCSGSPSPAQAPARAQWSLVRDYLIIPWVINEKTFFQYTVWEPSGGL